MMPMPMVIWFPPEEQFEEWKNYTGSDHASYSAYRLFSEKRVRDLGGTLVELNASVEEFKEVMLSRKLPNNGTGRSEAAAILAGARKNGLQPNEMIICKKKNDESR